LSGHGANPPATAIPLGTLVVMLGSSLVALGGIAVGWRLYSRRGPKSAEEPDPLETLQPDWFAVLRGKFFIDELYEMSVIRANAWSARVSRWLDEQFWNTVVLACSFLVLGLSWVNRLLDEFVVNLGFDRGCDGIQQGARWLSLWQNGQVQRYLRVIGLALVAFALAFIWGCRK
jgi:NADH-quinone oxidoreductase subunit L